MSASCRETALVTQATQGRSASTAVTQPSVTWIPCSLTMGIRADEGGAWKEMIVQLPRQILGPPRLPLSQQCGIALCLAVLVLTFSDIIKNGKIQLRIKNIKVILTNSFDYFKSK